jgi:hypothetical protein
MEVEFIGFFAKPDEYITGPLWMKNTSPMCGWERCVADSLVRKW